MKRLSLSAISLIAIFSSVAVQAVEINIETGKNKHIITNSVNEGKVVINGKVIKGATRKMTKQEQKQLEKELKQQEKNIENEMSELERMFD